MLTGAEASLHYSTREHARLTAKRTSRGGVPGAAVGQRAAGDRLRPGRPCCVGSQLVKDQLTVYGCTEPKATPEGKRDRLGLLLKKHLMSPHSPSLCEEFVEAMKLDKLPDSADRVKIEV